MYSDLFRFICAPRSSEGERIVLSIVEDILTERMDDCRIPDPVFPMTSDQDELESHRLWPEWLQLNLRVARDVAFITGGSRPPTAPSVVCSVALGIWALRARWCWGVTSFTACAAAAGKTFVEVMKSSVVPKD